MAAATLSHGTDPRDTAIHLKLALDFEGQWKKLRAELQHAEALHSFLEYVVRRVPFYQRTHDTRLSRQRELSSFPILGRPDYNDNPEQFLARGHRNGDDRLLYALTNGTMGPELRVQFDGAGWYEFNYGTYAAVADAIPGLLQQMTPCEECVFLVTNTPFEPRMSVYLAPLNATILRQLIIGYSKREDSLIVRYLRDRPGHLLYGKPSNLLQLAALDERLFDQAKAISPAAILVSGERLYEDQRRKLESWFACPVFNAYVATESGLIAIECAQRTGLHVREDFVRVEILNEAGEVCDEGKGEIVITNLFNRRQVFVRYLLGDRVEIKKGGCACGFNGATIVGLWGRDAESFVSPAGEIPVEWFDTFLTELPLKEFQVRQSGAREFVLKWVANEPDWRTIAKLQQRIDRWWKKRGWAAELISVPLTSITPPGGKQLRYPTR